MCTTPVEVNAGSGNGVVLVGKSPTLRGVGARGSTSCYFTITRNESGVEVTATFVAQVKRLRQQATRFDCKRKVVTD